MPTGAPGPHGPAAAQQLETRAGTGPERTPAWNPAPPAPSRTRSAAPPGTRRRGARESRASTRARAGGSPRPAGRGSERGRQEGPPEPGPGYGALGRRGKRRVGGEGEGKGTRERGAPGSGRKGPERGGGGAGEQQGWRGGGFPRRPRRLPRPAGTPSSKQRRLRRRRALRSGPPPVRPRRTKAPPHDPRPPGAPRFPEPCPRRPAPRRTTRSPAARRAQVPGALPPAPRAPPHSQDGGLRRHGGHGLQQQMHAAHRGAEAEAAARTPVGRPGGDLGQRPPAPAQHERQQAGARGAHGHDPRRSGRSGARTDSEGPGASTAGSGLRPPAAQARPTSQLCAGGGGRQLCTCARLRPSRPHLPEGRGGARTSGPERGGGAVPAAEDRLGPQGPVPGPRSRSGASPSGRCHTCAIGAFVVSENTVRGLRKFQAGFQALSLSLPSPPFSRPLLPPRLSPSLCFCLAVSGRPAPRQAAAGSEPGVGLPARAHEAC